uniref:2Fe-2S ferredoxin-type domain-containing protein n=1 Tax=Macrostomum lignano TaxID=282301 RepID=A0A1I8JDI3_9PLAT
LLRLLPRLLLPAAAPSGCFCNSHRALVRRPVAAATAAAYSSSSTAAADAPAGPPVSVTVIDKSGKEHQVSGQSGENLLRLLQRYELPVEGACEASLGLLHLSHSADLSSVTEAEEDMLDMAPFLRENSRLSCQIVLAAGLDGMRVTLPQATRNFYVDGHVPKPH